MPMSVIKFFKISLSCLLIFTFILFGTVHSSALPDIPASNAEESVYFWNAEYDKVIINRSATEKIYPASTTKIMTGLVAIDLIGDRLDQELILTSEMLLGKNGTSMQLKAGDTLTYRDLLYGAICGGFNDAANALAAASAGSISAFVSKMNEKAKSLGALDTHYTNPTGWHSDLMVTTLYDTSIIAKAAMKNELYVTVSSATSYTVLYKNSSDKFTVHNRNGLIASHYSYGYYNKRAKGLIAGMTDEGGYCVATFAEYDDLTYLCIVMGGKEENGVISSYDIANSLISYAISYYGELEVIEEGDTVAKVPLRYALYSKSGSNDEDGDQYILKCTVPYDIKILAPYDNDSLATLELKPYFIEENISAPVKEGEIVGGVDIFIDGICRGSAPLCASETVDASSFLLMMENAKNLLLSRVFLIFILTFIILFAIYFYRTELKSLRKKHKNIKFDKLY